MDGKRQIAILGSTGSIGTQALDVIRQHPERFVVSVLTANRNVTLLASQAREFVPNSVVIGDEDLRPALSEKLADLPVKVYGGEQSLESIVETGEVDMVLAAMVGFSGLKPVIRAIRAGKHIALANKETLVVAGGIIDEEIRKSGVGLIPVDSEHSALFQCLVGEGGNPVEKIYLTASGGPFRGYSKDQLQKVTREMALRHPNWDMGAKITVDSASMMNKGLEVIEAKWLFGLKAEQIDIVVHPQSVIHSIVQFCDGSMKAQMGLPDMKLPIQYALAYPDRLANEFPRFNFASYASLTFEAVDREVFPCVELAFRAMSEGGNVPCIMNAANEIAVEMFLKDVISFSEIPGLVADAMSGIGKISSPGLEDLAETDKMTRDWAMKQVTKTSY